MESAGRAASTAIYFLLARGERSRWHRVDAAEAWHYYAGAPLELEISADGNAPVERLRLGVDLAAGERPQAVVPAHAWQAAASLGDWTLVGCTVAPGFMFSGFEMAPPEWAPTGPMPQARTRPIEVASRRRRHTMTCPPLADKVEPVMRPLSSEARNTTQRATSSGSPSRPIGISGRIDFSSTSLGTACTISVLM